MDHMPAPNIRLNSRIELKVGSGEIDLVPVQWESNYIQLVSRTHFIHPGQNSFIASLKVDGEVQYVLEFSIQKTIEHSWGIEIVALFPDGIEHLWQALVNKEFIEHTKSLANKEVVGHILEEPPRLPSRSDYSESARSKRLQLLRIFTKKALDRLDHHDFAPEELKHNVESMIGSVEIPVGVAGPLQINFSGSPELIYAPFACSEGALVASATRGAFAITKSGGIEVAVIDQRMTRAPEFEFSKLYDALIFLDWVKANFYEIRRVAEQKSRHARLKEIESECVGRHVRLHFVYTTGDAAGQNMTTACTWHACLWIVSQIDKISLPLLNYVVDSNASSDKKVSSRNLIRGRGTRVVVECTLQRNLIRRVLRVDPDHLLRIYNRMLLSAVTSGMSGFNINSANAVSAIFAATGQDLGSAHESSISIFGLESGPNDSIKATMTMPCLVVGTVGGGTGLPKQQQYLDLMGCAGNNKAHRLAAVIAGYCLALDISTCSAAAAGEFADAHERLGRNRPLCDAPPPS